MDLTECIHSKIESIRDAKEQRYQTQLTEIKQRISFLTRERSRLFAELEDALHQGKSTSHERSTIDETSFPDSDHLQSDAVASPRESGNERTTLVASAVEAQSSSTRNGERDPDFPDDDDEEDFALEVEELNALPALFDKERARSQPRTLSPNVLKLGNETDHAFIISPTSTVTGIISTLRKKAAETDELLQEDRALMTALRSEHNSMLARLDELERETCHAAEVWESEESARLSVATTSGPLKRKRVNYEEVPKSSRRKLGESILMKTTQLVGTAVGTAVGTVAFHHLKGNINAWDFIKSGATRMI